MSRAKQGVQSHSGLLTQALVERAGVGVSDDVVVGVALNDALLTDDPVRRRALLQHVAEAGLDHVSVGDHIDFHDGTGFDGLVAATAALASEDTLRVLVGVYLAALRHPLATARALATLAQIAPGRVILGVGVGGEDRREIANMGVDPATRGRRLDETLQVLRAVAGGEPVDHSGRFFDMSAARISPAPHPAIPIVVGGAGEVAVRRVAAYGDGWLGMWCSVRRFATTWEQISHAVSSAGRPEPGFAGLTVWCGFGADEPTGRTVLERHLLDLYRLPGEKFRHLTPAGSPEDVAAFLRPYIDAGARSITLIPVAHDTEAAIEGAATVRRLLRDSGGDHVPDGSD